MATVQSLFLAGSNFSFLYASHFLLSVFPLLALFAARSLYIIQPHLEVCVCVCVCVCVYYTQQSADNEPNKVMDFPFRAMAKQVLWREEHCLS